MDRNRPLFVYFRPFLNTMTNTVENLTINRVIDVLGTRTRGSRMVGTDESTELWRHPIEVKTMSDPCTPNKTTL